MRICYLPTDPGNYRDENSLSPLDRRRLAVLIPLWQSLGMSVMPYHDNALTSCDVVYCVSVQHCSDATRSTLQSLLRKRRRPALVVGVIEDLFYDFYAACPDDDCMRLEDYERRYHSGFRDLARRVRWSANKRLRVLPLPRDLRYEKMEIVRRSDAVVCTSAGQASLIRQVNLRVVDIADAMPDSDFKHAMCTYKEGPVTIVWEGTNWGLQLVDLVRPAMEQVAAMAPVPVEFLFLAPRLSPTPFHGLCDNVGIMSRDFNLPCRHEEWSLETVGQHLSGASIGIAPMPVWNPYYLNKAFSKPLSYMAVGLPVVASSIPSYRELMTNGVNGFLARNHEDWVSALTALVESTDLRRQIGQAGRETLIATHSVEAVAESFLKVFENAVRWKRSSN